MTRRWLPVCDLACAALLGCASMLVPRGLRAHWMREWRTELWYARRTYATAGAAEVDWSQLLGFCLGAFADARSLRPRRVPVGMGGGDMRGSARECGLLLLALLAMSVGVGLLLPNVRSRLVPLRGPDAQNLMLIENTDRADQGDATLPAAQIFAWRGRRQQIFESFAFYHLRSARFAEGSLGGRPDPMRVAYATENLFEVLGLPVVFHEHPDRQRGDGAMGIVLSRELWRSHFHGEWGVVGREVRLSAGVFVIEAIAPAAATQLPGHPDAWVLVPDSSLRATQTGFVLGRVSPSFHEAAWGDRWQMTAPLPGGSSSDFTCSSLQQELHEPLDLFLFAVFLALLALPATTSLPLGEYRCGERTGARSARLRRWLFLLSKMGLVLAIVYCGSIDLAFADERMSADMAAYLQLVSCFGFCLWGLRWVLRDQRQRCPVCLGKLTHPARVGDPSRSFLTWNGTELMCAGGHGLLHVPGMATSWFSTQRWLYLDASWQVLFSERGLVSTPRF